MAVSQMRPALVALLFFARVTVSIGAYSVADDLPNPPAHLTMIPAGSWIIPMDTNLQALVAPFNLKAYGLANLVLQNQTPIMWAIKAGKAKDGVDFTASTSRLFPSTTVTNSLNFAGGPFIIHRDFVNSVSNSVRTFALANNVAVYVLQQDTTIDIRYTLDFKPLVGINTVNASIHSTYLVAAGITNYALVPDTATLQGVCYTLFCEPHNSSIAGVSNVHAYVQSGGNFLAECLSVATYENHTNGHLQTTLGIAENNLNAVLSYPNSDLPFSQFIGDLDGSIGGSHTDWSLGASSVWTNRGHAHAFATSATNTLQATASKETTNGAGGMVFYLGGHSYATSPLNELNGIRMFLNAVFVPISRPIVCGVMLSADLAVAKSGPTNVWAGTNFSYTITVTNLGPSPAVSLVVTDSLPAGVTFVSASAGGGLAGSQVVWTNLGNLLVGATTNLTLTVTAPANGGSLTNRASAGSDISDFNPTNSISGPIITTVTPVADVTISKSGPAASVLPGANFDYTISITNLGPSTASGLSVTDSLPANVTFVSATPSATLNGRIVTWTNLGNLAAGASTNLTLTVAAPLRGSVTNVASGGSGTLDPNPTNNAAPPVATIISNLPPVAGNDSASTPKNIGLTISPLGNDSDPNNDPLTITSVSPTNGTATIQGGTNVLFTPAANFIGTTTIGYLIDDGAGGTAFGLITVTVTNRPPVANDDAVTTPEDTAITFNPRGNDTDADGDAITITLATATNGTVTIVGGTNLLFTPAPDFSGTETVAYQISDGSGGTASATVLVTVTPVNDAPVAFNQSVITPEDTTTNLLLTASDVDSTNLTFAILNAPTNGVLSLFNPNTGAVTYSPNTNYNGPDFFRFTVSDGSLLATGTVSITVTPVNDAPVAVNDSFSTFKNVALSLAAPGVLVNDTDVESNILSGVLVTTVTHGTLSLNPNGGFLYTPSSNYTGADSFTYRAYDSGATGNVATVNISIGLTNTAPVANNDSYTTAEDTTLAVPVAGVLTNDSDADADALTATLVTGPTHGTLNLDANGGFTYTPATNYSGPDSFTYRANDGLTNSAVATVNITVTPVNDAPLADSQSVTTPEDKALPITLTGSDVDGPAINFVIVTLPTHGTLTGSGANLTYQPATNYTGPDSFTFTVNDGSLTSAVATVSINVTPVNDAPVAFSQSLTNGNSFPLPITLTGADVDGPVTNFTVLTLPGGGPLTGTAPTLTFTPTNQFAGVVTFTFTVHDGALTSAVATVTITITNSTPATADIAVTKTGPVAGLAGADLTYAITITNFGANTATNVIVQDQLPVGFTFVSATPAAASVVNNLVSWSPFNLASGRASNFTVTARAAQGGAYTNVASGTSDTPDPLPGNNTATNGGGRVTTTITPQADVAVSKSGPAGVTAGANFSYTISITNLGPSTASNVVAVDNLPASVTFVSASSGGTLGGGNVVTWPATTLAANMVTNFTVTVTAPPSGMFTNTASASSPTGDPNPTNNVGTNGSAQVTTTVGVLADVAVTVSGPATVLAGATYTYVVNVTNFGPSGATNVLATNTLPPGVVFISTTGGGTQTGGNVTWPAITLAGGAGTNFTITVTAPPSGVLTNRAAGSSLTSDPDLSNNNGSASGAIVVTTVTPQADVAVGKSGPANVLAGANVTYTISVTNLGPSTANNIIAQDFLPTNATFVSASSGGTLGASNIVTWPATTLAANTVTNFSVTISAPASGSLLNRAAANSPTGDPNPTNNVGTNTGAQVTTTVTPQADVVATIDGPATVLAGATYSYTVFVTNLGPSTATNVFTTNLLPATVTFVSANSGGTLFIGRVFWPAVTLPVGAGTSYTATVTAPAEGVLTARGQGGSRTPDPDLGNNTGFNLGGFVDTTVIPQADVAVSKFGPSSVFAGATYNYNIVVTNLGPSTASNVVASDNLPASVTFVSATASGTLGTNNLVTWPATTILSGDSAIFTFTVTAPAEGAYTNTASATSPTGDPNPGNNTGTNTGSLVTTTVTPQADVAVGKSGPATVLAGANFSYTISVTNFGPSTASNVAVVDHLPRGVTFVSANSGGFNDFGNVNWTVPAMLSGAVTNFTLTLTAPASGAFTNHTSATSPTDDPNPGNNAPTNVSGQVVTTVTPQADIAVGKTGPAAVQAGANVTYTISVTNLGPSTASNVVAVDTLPSNATFVSASSGSTLGGGNVVTWPATTLLSGATATFTVTVTAPASGSLFNTASASSPTSDPNPGNNTGTNGSSQVSTAITPLADIVVTVTGPTNALAGSNITYTITITNFGPSIARDVFVANTLPPGISLVSASDGGNATYPVVLWPLISSLARGEGRSFTFTITAPPGGWLEINGPPPSVVTNTASGGSSTPDPNLSNNSSIATTTITPQADVIVGKSGPATATAGSNFMFTISITNFGPSTASNVVAVDNLPATVTFVSASGGGTLGLGNVVTWPATTLAANTRTNFTVTVTSVTVGTITNRASATSPTGDPNPGNNTGTNTGSRVVTTVVSGIQFGLLAGPAVFNPQTGLFEERVTVTNIGFTTIAATRLYVSSLSTNATFSNPSGVSGGIPYAQYNAPLNPGQTVVFMLEFFVPNRRPFTSTLTLEAVLPAITGTNSGAGGINISRAFVDARPPNAPRFVIEFPSTAGRVYTILYRDSLSSPWKVATPSVTAGSNRTQWYDDGPPKTDGPPLTNGSRYYRVIVAPLSQ